MPLCGYDSRRHRPVHGSDRPPTLSSYIYAVLAEQKRTFISERTKTALKSLEASAAGGDAEAVQKISNRSQALAKGRIKLNRTKGHDTQRQQADDRAALVKDAIELCVLKGGSGRLLP